MIGDENGLDFRRKIRNLREDADITQSQLGMAINTTQRKILYIDCAKYEPNIEDIVALCNFFKVSADYLLDIPCEYKTVKDAKNNVTIYKKMYTLT